MIYKQRLKKRTKAGEATKTFRHSKFGYYLHLVELDNGLIVDAPPGKEFGWVPIVLEVEMPYGKWQTELDFVDTERGSILDY